jgi:hypothetical protein
LRFSWLTFGLNIHEMYDVHGAPPGCQVRVTVVPLMLAQRLTAGPGAWPARPATMPAVRNSSSTAFLTLVSLIAPSYGTVMRAFGVTTNVP